MTCCTVLKHSSNLCTSTECVEKRNKWIGLQSIYAPKGQVDYEKFLKLREKNLARTVYDSHLLLRLQERGITTREVEEALSKGIVVERIKKTGETDVSYVILGYTRKFPLHIVIQKNVNCWIVKTAYDPSSQAWKWNDSFNERVCFCNK